MSTAPLRAKTATAVGLLTMVFGAFLVIAPGAGAAHWDETTVNPGENDNPSCADLGYDVEAKDNTERNAPYSGSVEAGDGLDPEGFLRVDYTLNTDGTVDFVVDQDDTEEDPASDYAVAAVIIKKGSTDSGGGARVYEYDPATLEDEGLQTIPAGATSFSHITFCGGELPPYECPPNTVHSGDDGDGVQEEGECNPPYTCPADTPVHDDVDGDGFEEEGECQPYECPPNTVHSGDDGDGVEEEGECEPPYSCPADTPVHNDTDNDGFEEPGECSEVLYECPVNTVHSGDDGDGVEEEGECEPPYSCPADTPVHTDTDNDGFEEPGECSEVKDDTVVRCPSDMVHDDANDNGKVDDGECKEPQTTPVTCPEGTKHTDVNGDGVVQASECTEVLDSSTPKPVITPTQKVTPKPAVLESTNRRALAATGSTSDSLTTVGVALILFGAVLSIGSRRRVRYLR